MCSTRSGHWSAHRPRAQRVPKRRANSPPFRLVASGSSLLHSKTHAETYTPSLVSVKPQPYGCRMPMRVTPTRLRDELTELWLRASAGEHLVAAGVHQAPVLIRPVHRRDHGARIGLTVLRRQLHRILRQAAHEPIIVTVVGEPILWLGRMTEPAAACGPDRHAPHSLRRS